MYANKKSAKKNQDFPWLYNYEPDPTGYFYRRQKENTTNRTPWLFKSSPTILTTCASQLFNFEKILATALLISCLFSLRYRIVFEKIPHHSPRVDLIKKTRRDLLFSFLMIPSCVCNCSRRTFRRCQR